MQFYVTAVLTVAALRGHPGRGRDGGDAGARQRVPGPARARHPDADGSAVRGSLVVLLRMIQPERLLRVESLPDITGSSPTLQSPVTLLLPSFWAGETLFASLQGGCDWLHVAALWTTALGADVVARRGLRAVALHRLQQGAGGAQGALHAAAMARAAGARCCRSRPCGGTC